MDFELSEEQTLVQQTARDFVTRVCPAELAKEWDEKETFPGELLRGMADMGWFSLPFSEEEGGDGGSPLDLVLIAEQLGRSSFDISMCYAGVLIPALTIFRWGSPELKDWVRERVMTGTHRLAVAMSEPDSGSDAAALRTTAVASGDHYVVNGQKMWCTGGSLPDTTLMTYVRTGAREPKHAGLSLLLIDPDSAGVQITRMATLARHILGTTEVAFTDVQVPKDKLVGPQDGGWKVMLSNLELEKVLISGGYLGAAQSTL